MSTKMMPQTDKPFTITIDGPSGVGKSTLAGLVAAALDIPCLDTGAMYRTLALNLGDGAEHMPAEELRARCGEFVFALESRAGRSVLVCNGIEIGDEIRNETVGAMASRLSAVPAVRECLQEAQRAIGRTVSLVAEGRDMGSKVFVDAQFKFFLEATPEERARRRYQELVCKGTAGSIEEIAAQLRTRDEADRGRAIDPLRPAEDAVVIDTTSMSREAVLAEILGRVRGGER